MQDHAVVLGGSIAGLLAARVLADTYPQVTVLDRDALAPGVAPRRGVPQGRHIHALLARGQLVLEELFPGLTDELVAQRRARRRHARRRSAAVRRAPPRARRDRAARW